MKWRGRAQSKNVEDRRKGGGATKVAAGGGIIAVVFFVFQFLAGGGDTTQLIQQAPQIIEMMQGQKVESQVDASELTQAEKDQLEFVSVVLNDTEEVWEQIFRENGLTYKHPKFVLFSNAVQSACGNAGTSSGPFYCSADETIYMDMAFFGQLGKQFNTNIGEFAIAYVIAHEVGHHVQHLLGVLKKTRELQSKVSEKESNEIMVAVELQADFYAGLWANKTEEKEKRAGRGGFIETGDIQDGLNAAATVGDDNIQKKIQGYVVPESFTHGTSEQRMYWFSRGFKIGDIRQGDTFSELLK